MSSRATPYTAEEDAIIINKVKDYPTNLSYAFSEAAILLPHRGRNNIQARWYQVLKKKDTVAVSVGSVRGFTKNSKNNKRNEDGELPEQGLKNHLFLIHEILELPQAEREAIIKLLTL